MRQISKEESLILSLIRVCAFTCILICHACGSLSRITSLEKVFDVGNSVFFLLSGFLIGIKGIDDSKAWIVKRLKRILPQYYIVIIVLSVLFPHKVSISSVLAGILNLQGFIQYYSPYAPHLWFISVMMVFYFFAPTFEKLVNHKLTFRGFVLLEMGLIAFAFGNCFLWTSYAILDLSNFSIYFVLFLLGMRLGAFWDRNVSSKVYVALTILMVLANSVRVVLILYTNQGCPDLVNNIYIHFYAGVSHAVFALWIAATLYKIGTACYGSLKKLQKPITFLDGISYEIYLVHKPLLYGNWCLTTITPWIGLDLILFVVASVLLALVLQWISRKLGAVTTLW